MGCANLYVLLEGLDGVEEVSLPILQGGDVLLLIFHLPFIASIELLCHLVRVR